MGQSDSPATYAQTHLPKQSCLWSGGLPRAMMECGLWRGGKRRVTLIPNTSKSVSKYHLGMLPNNPWNRQINQETLRVLDVIQCENVSLITSYFYI